MSTWSAAWRRPAVTENRIDQEEKVCCPACRAGKMLRGEQTRLSLGLLTPAAQRTPSQELVHVEAIGSCAGETACWQTWSGARARELYLAAGGGRHGDVERGGLAGKVCGEGVLEDAFTGDWRVAGW